MTDHPIPDDLAYEIAHIIHDANYDCEWPDCGHDGAPELIELGAWDVLHALASWADGHLIDPDGWRRVKAREVGGWNDAGDMWAWEERPYDTLDSVPIYSLDPPLTPAPEEET